MILASTQSKVIPFTGENTKMAYVESIASTPYDSDSLYVVTGFHHDGLEHLMVDVAVGAGGSEEVIVPNLYYSQIQSANHQASFDLPVSLAEGERVAFRAQTSSTNVSDNTCRTDIYAIRRGAWAISPGCSRVVDMGLNLSTTKGVSVDPGATVNTKGAWAEITASTPNDFSALAVSISNNNVASGQTPQVMGHLVDVGIGAAGSEEVIAKNMPLHTNTSNSPGLSKFGRQFVINTRIPIPSGTRIAVRAQCNENQATGRILFAGAFGIAA